MIIGIPAEIKSDEYRIAMLPVGAHLLSEDGHTVLVQKNAGIGSGYENHVYTAAGAKLVDTADEVFAEAEMIVKVKEPQSEEIAKLRKGQIAFCYFHFASSRELTEECLEPIRNSTICSVGSVCSLRFLSSM